jgi:hypothetical protein
MSEERRNIKLNEMIEPAYDEGSTRISLSALNDWLRLRLDVQKSHTLEATVPTS